MKHISNYVKTWHEIASIWWMEAGRVAHHWDSTWPHLSESVIQLQPPHQRWRAMCPGGVAVVQKPKLMEAEPRSKAQINTRNQAANSHDNSRVSERKHFVKLTVCCLIAVFSHLHSLSQQLSWWRDGVGWAAPGSLLLFCRIEKGFRKDASREEEQLLIQ